MFELIKTLLYSTKNYDATLADMTKYVQSLDFGDSAVGLHVDLSKYKVRLNLFVYFVYNTYIYYTEPRFRRLQKVSM